MKSFQLASAAALMLGFLLTISGCGGAAENSVSEAPETVPTAEELAESYQSQASDYAQEQKDMRKRDSSR